MITLELLYTVAAIVALSACIPQMHQLVITKQSDELSLAAWSLWTITQVATLVYVVSIGNVLMMCVNVAWVTFYGAMTALIVRYRVAPIVVEKAEVEPASPVEP